MPQLYANFPTVTHSLDGFTERLNDLYVDDDNDSFIKTALTGQYVDESGTAKQIFVDPLLNQVNDTDSLKFTRDYDSAIGIGNDILVCGPVTLHAIPHPTFALTTSVHLQFPISRADGGTDHVEFHRIPNFEFGTFGTRHQLHLFFPRLWSKDRANPSRLTQGERSFFYKKAIRPAIRHLLGEEVVSQWPASVETEEIRARKRTGHHSYGSRLIPARIVGELMDSIREVLQNNPSLNQEDQAWASEVFVMHTIRGVKHAYLHSPQYFDGVSHLRKLFSDACLTPEAHSDGHWWIDIGIEISSNEGHCLQWVTAHHWKVVQYALEITEHNAKRITSIRSSSYSRDLSSHLTAISGFRIMPGARAAGRFKVPYLQAYTTDKTVVYNPEGIHHAKFVPASQAFGAEQPGKSIDGIHTIYEAAREDNGSNARLEVRVPYACVSDILIDLDEQLFREALCSFTRDTWWNFRIIRLIAISRVFSLQEGSPSSIRFMDETILLTAACLWLVNSLHARPEDGPASRDLMRATLPVTEESDTIQDVLAYNTSVRPPWQNEDDDIPRSRIQGIPYNPYGLVFFRTIMLEANKVDVPRFCCGGPCISPNSFTFFFDGMSVDDVRSKFHRTLMVDREVIAKIRPTNKGQSVRYINTTGAPEPNLFDLTALGYALPPPVCDDGSDLDERPSPPPDDGPKDIDSQLSEIWRQFVIDIIYKAPNQRGMTNPSHIRISQADRFSASETHFRTLNLAEVFNAVWYKNASLDQWKLSFNWLFPPLGRQVSTAVQNYGSCKYYLSWMELLDNNRNDAPLIEAIRAKFFKRIREWRWMPNAQSDRIWPTSAKKPSSRTFTRWPPAENRPPAPHILLHSREQPIFETLDNDERLA